MLLVLEIILTITAWRKGWKWIALIPVGLVFLIGFIGGLTGAIDPAGDSAGYAIVLDIIGVIALVVLAAMTPKNVKKVENLAIAKEAVERFCSDCKAKIEGDSKFCSSCGKPA